jgi:hypothetical protein
MTEIATREGFAPTPATGFGGFAAPASHLPARAQSDQFVRMRKWLDLFMATEQVAQVLARTAFVPEPMRGQPENIAAAMMKSLELGIDPLDGLSSIHVVKGKIGFSAEFMRRRILEAGHEIVIDESTDSRCKIRGRRSGSTEWQTVVFTEEQAKKAKITLGDYPADKLVARASSRLCRRVFPDVLAGTTIVDEFEDVEIVDGVAAAAAPVQRKRQPRAVKASAAPKPKPEVVDDVDELLGDDESETASDIPAKDIPANVTPEVEQDDLLDDEPPAPAEDQVTKSQLQKLAILRQEEKYEDDADGRADWFAFVTNTIGRTINASNKEMTKWEASKVIDLLESSRQK